MLADSEGRATTSPPRISVPQPVRLFIKTLQPYEHAKFFALSKSLYTEGLRGEELLTELMQLAVEHRDGEQIERLTTEMRDRRERREAGKPNRGQERPRHYYSTQNRDRWVEATVRLARELNDLEKALTRARHAIAQQGTRAKGVDPAFAQLQPLKGRSGGDVSLSTWKRFCAAVKQKADLNRSPNSCKHAI